MQIKVGKVGMIPIDSVIITNRARKEMGDLDSIEESMKENGLITPIAVIDLGNNTYELLAGERRITILKRNNITEIPVRIYDKNISEIEKKSIELAENLDRKNFEYWEKDALVLEIHKLQQSIHGIKLSGPSSTGWGTAETGEMVGKSKGHISSAIKRAEARDQFPDLFDGCKDQKDAMRMISKMSEMMTNEVIAKQLESGVGKVNDLAKYFILKDFFAGVKEIPDNLMHLVEIDPPYAIDLMKIAKRKNSESQYNEDSYNEIPSNEYKQFIKNLFKECYRVMAENSWLICWFAPEPWFEFIIDELKIAGFEVKRMPGIWTKPNGQTKHPDLYLGNAYEMFFYACKGRPVINKAGRSNVFNYSPVSPSLKIHPTERPIELTKEIYDTFAFQGSRVLIPFLGSGNGIIAAAELKMNPVGFELGKSYRDSFLVRLNNRI